ncbi:hypothetical protein ONZ45_g130 [Pleurotus djamor]|nr:hypothetical protein ONZ45_g130 [Pleurotus djamor]
MSRSYAPLPNPRSDREAREEMDAAFDDSGDEDDFNDASESHPLNPHPTSPTAYASSHTIPSYPTPQSHSNASRHLPGTYDFERVDYDYPPPGSPPAPSAFARPNDIGNSNGEVPEFELNSVHQPRQGWLRRTLAVALPSSVSQRLGVVSRPPRGAVGGGINNDGVFANVTAKPTAPRPEADDANAAAEDARSDAPPSYASAQADAVPPYWETTVHAPFSPDAIGEMIVDNLPTGSLFSFLWNMLVSISFQFVGFLLTYLLHTTHAARLGSRAGLGVTLIQYGFALRDKAGDVYGDDRWGNWDGTPPTANPTGPTGTYGADYTVPSLGPFGLNATSPLSPEQEQANQLASQMASATTEWLSFFLMTVGWFILLTSFLGFFRVKRWERGIYESQQTAATSTSNESDSRSFPFPIFTRVSPYFSMSGSERMDMLRRGLGLRPRGQVNEIDEEAEVVASHQARRVEEGGSPNLSSGRRDANDEDASESDPMIPAAGNGDMRTAIVRDRQLETDLRRAGFI